VQRKGECFPKLKRGKHFPCGKKNFIFAFIGNFSIPHRTSKGLKTTLREISFLETKKA
jgi:hypothetical protein